MKTLCEHCIFAKKPLNIQTGCELNRIRLHDNVNGAELQENGFFIINDYCNGCRNIYWDKYDTSKSMSELKELVIKEIEIKYDVIMNIDSQYIEDVRQTIINCQLLPIKPKNIVMTGTISQDNIEKCLCFPNLVSSLDRSEDKFTQVRSYARKSTANYLLFVNVGTELGFDPEYFNKKLNEDLDPAIYYDGEGCFLVSTKVYHMFMHEPHPITSIVEKYEQNGKPKSKRTDS